MVLAISASVDDLSGKAHRFRNRIIKCDGVWELAAIDGIPDCLQSRNRIGIRDIPTFLIPCSEANVSGDKATTVHLVVIGSNRQVLVG